MTGCKAGILMLNSRKLALFKVVRYDKTLFGMYVIVWYVAFFCGVDRKKKFAIFKNLSVLSFRTFSACLTFIDAVWHIWSI